MEETGITVQPLAVVGVVDLIEWDEQRVRYHYTLIDILAAFVDGEAVAAADAAEVLWVEQAEVKQKVLWPETVRIIDRACRMYATRRSDPTG